jgi:hypothetical protein
MKWLLALAVCVAVALGGCGGGSDDSASTASGTSAEAASAPQPSQQSTSTTVQGQDKSKQDQSSTAAKGESAQPQQASADSKKHLKLVRVPPISTAPKAGSKRPAPGVKTVPGGDNSVQEYGVEAGESERTEAAIALQAYLNARAEEDWGSACSLLAKRPMEQLERMQSAAAKQGKDLGGCAGTMALLGESEARALQQAQITEVLSLRGEGDVSGDPSYLIFKGPPGQTLFSMPMYWESGAWKVGLARAAELPVG